jgi:hypothetical protein
LFVFTLVPTGVENLTLQSGHFVGDDWPRLDVLPGAVRRSHNALLSVCLSFDVKTAGGMRYNFE